MKSYKYCRSGDGDIKNYHRDYRENKRHAAEKKQAELKSEDFLCCLRVVETFLIIFK